MTDEITEKIVEIDLSASNSQLSQLIGTDSKKIILELNCSNVQSICDGSSIVPTLLSFKCLILEIIYIHPLYFTAGILNYFKLTKNPAITFEYESLNDLEHTQVVDLYTAISQNPNIRCLASYESQIEYDDIPFNNHITKLVIPLEYILEVNISEINNAKLESLTTDNILDDDSAYIDMIYQIGKDSHGHLTKILEICKKCRHLTEIAFNHQSISDLLVHRSQFTLLNSILETLEHNKITKTKARKKFVLAIGTILYLSRPGINTNSIISHRQLLMMICKKLSITDKDYCWF